MLLVAVYPILYQHLFWFFAHPEVYIVLLPIWGFMPDILQTFTRKPVFGYKAQVYSLIAIGILALVVWAHHFFTAGMPIPALALLYVCNYVYFLTFSSAFLLLDCKFMEGFNDI